MKRARIFHQGREVWAVVHEDGTLHLACGTCVMADAAHWLAPVTPGATIFALGLNYADHCKELGFSAQQAEPLIFLKGHATFVGHNGSTPRPADGNQMHPECELVAIIGKPARRVARGDALACVSGYTIANDYAIREYLENFYRPNARVKNRDATTPLGPWIVDATDIDDPQSLTLQTRVNGAGVQQGSTADMILDVAGLIEYLSSFMTLMPGDMILTGTPHGVHFCAPGDLVECEISGIGTLASNLVAAK
jgi:5-oxopent-3-ene-1,2,5-tricarboxylate decarboxylase / 2-hydroxyhepta-2,4-diene-1,7-dioate isomerase